MPPAPGKWKRWLNIARITLDEYEEFPTLPADSIVHLKVVDNTVREVKGAKGNWEKIEFTFKVLGIQVTGDGSPIEDYDVLIGRSIYGSTAFRFNNSPENKLKAWVEAILGMDLTLGFELDTDLLNNKQVRGITSTYDKRTTDPRTGLPLKAHQIDSLLPMGGSVLNPASAGDPWSNPAAATLAAVADPWTQSATASASVAQPAMSGGWEDPPPF